MIYISISPFRRSKYAAPIDFSPRTASSCASSCWCPWRRHLRIICRPMSQLVSICPCPLTMCLQQVRPARPMQMCNGRRWIMRTTSARRKATTVGAAAAVATPTSRPARHHPAPAPIPGRHHVLIPLPASCLACRLAKRITQWHHVAASRANLWTRWQPWRPRRRIASAWMTFSIRLTTRFPSRANMWSVPRSKWWWNADDPPIFTYLIFTLALFTLQPGEQPEWCRHLHQRQQQQRCLLAATQSAA